MHNKKNVKYNLIDTVSFANDKVHEYITQLELTYITMDMMEYIELLFDKLVKDGNINGAEIYKYERHQRTKRISELSFKFEDGYGKVFIYDVDFENLKSEPISIISTPNKSENWLHTQYVKKMNDHYEHVVKKEYNCKFING